MNELKLLLDLYDGNDRFKAELEHYQRLIGLPEFEFFKNCLLTIKGQISREFFTKRFTDLSAEEKDVQQRVYYKLDSWLDFFINPVGKINKRKSLNNISLNLTPGKDVPNRGGKEQS